MTVPAFTAAATTAPPLAVPAVRLLLLGDTSATLDEGAKNVANYLTGFLSARHQVLQLHQRAVIRPTQLWRAMQFRPQVVMSVQGPSAKTIALLALLRWLCHRPRTLAIGAQPATGRALLWALRWLPPSCLFAQSRRWIERFAPCGVPVRRLPNGVNVAKFRLRAGAADAAAVQSLRDELGLPPGRRVALHIGPLNRNRNHQLLVRLQQQGQWQVLMVGSTTAPFVPEVQAELVAAGVVVARRYFADISAVYALADAYVFPVVDAHGSIEFPLTVLEAMACDVPVVSTRFLALPEYLDEGAALAYFDGSLEGLGAALGRVQGQRGNRLRAEAFAWEHVVALVESEFHPEGA
jgi:glycosyltransferase involved in cell wall biosynthesis